MTSIEMSSVTLSARAQPFPGGDAFGSVVWLQGEHDLSTVAQLTAVMDRAMAIDDAGVVVDLSGVLFMGAATVGALVRARQRLAARSRSLSLRSPSPRARRVVDLCGLSSLVEPEGPRASRVAPSLPPAALRLEQRAHQDGTGGPDTTTDGIQPTS